MSLQAQLRCDLGAGHLLGRVVEEERDRHRRADLREMLDHHRRRRRPVVGRGGDDRGGASVLGMARERCRDGGAGIARMRDHRHAAGHVLDREFEERALLRVGEAHRLARMHRQRQRVGAVRDVEIDQLAVAVEVDAVVARERRHRRVDEAWREDGHGYFS